MLREFKNVKQDEPNHYRRWFSSEEVDLVVWYDDEKEIDGFQICFEVGTNKQHALTWKRDTGFDYNKVDSGDDELITMSSVLSSPSDCPWKELLYKFEQESLKIDKIVRNFILQLIESKMDEVTIDSKMDEVTIDSKMDKVAEEDNE